jgi:hypothetical protein
MKHPKPALSRFYPRWITDREGIRRIVDTPALHANYMLCEFNEEAQPLYPPPPTLREVLEQGYAPEVALELVREEERKARNNEWPYYVGAPATPPLPGVPSVEPAADLVNPDPPPAEPYPAAEVIPPAGPPATPEEAAALGIQAPISEPLPEEVPELPHETELATVDTPATSETDEIAAMFAPKTRGRGRRRE